MSYQYSTEHRLEWQPTRLAFRYQIISIIMSCNHVTLLRGENGKVIIRLQHLAGAVLAPLSWGISAEHGSLVSEGEGVWHSKNIVDHMFEYAIYDIKAAYSH